MGPGCD